MCVIDVIFFFLQFFNIKDNNCYRYLRILMEIILFYNNWNILLKDIQLSTSQDPYKFIEAWGEFKNENQEKCDENRERGQIESIQLIIVSSLPK